MQLIRRSTRHFSVTEIGQTYYANCKAMLVEAEAAQEAIELTRSEPSGAVRVTCPVSLLSAWVSPMLAAFMAQHPRVDIHLEPTDRRVDLVREAVDVALRVRPLPLEDSELVMRHLGNARQCLVASPDLLNQVGAPRVPADLTRLPSLGSGEPHHEFEWILLGPGGAQASVKHRPRFITRNMIALRDAALAGVGSVQLPVMMVRDELAREALVRLGSLPEDRLSALLDQFKIDQSPYETQRRKLHPEFDLNPVAHLMLDLLHGCACPNRCPRRWAWA